MDYAQKVTVVTGASSGIGRKTALAPGGRGVTVLDVAWMGPIALEVIDDARERARRSRQD